MSTPPPFVFEDLPLALPAGFAAVPLSDDSNSPCRAAVVMSTKGDPALVVLRELLDARTYLACEIDASSRVLRWFELWVQEVDGLANSLPAYRQALNNKALDARWTARAALFEKLGASGLVHTGFEEQHPPPMFVDPQRRRVLRPSHEGGDWALCTNDSDLTSGGLPAYSSCGQRFLYVSKLGAQSPFVPATRDSGADSPESIAQQVGISGSPRPLPLNAGAGLLMLRPLAPFPLEAYADAIAGFSNEGLTESMLASLGAAVAGSSPSGGFLYLGEPGRQNRPAEILHLKLRLLADAVNAVRTTLAETQRPMLNVSPSSFRVDLGLGSSTAEAGIPYLWTARAELVESGEAIELPVKTTSASFFMASGAAGPTIYTAGAVGRAVSGRGLLRIRKTIVEGGLTMVEATLTSSERFTPGRNDLVWIHFSAGGGRFDLYGLTDEQRALAGGELRFRTIAQRLGDKESGQLKAAEGIPIQDASFEVLPQLSSPCDLYSLAVLAVRLLLSGGENTLAVALDEMMSLTYEANGSAGSGDDSGGESKPLHKRVQELLKDKRWSSPLGPHRLMAGIASADEAFEVIPADLWARTLAMIVRMFPGIGPESRCRDFGDATPGGLHKVFDRTGADLADLLNLSRGLVIGHQRANREIASIVAGVLARA